MLIDTHAHLHFSNFKGEVDRVLAAAEKAKIKKIITVGVNTHDSRAAVGLAQRYANVWAAVGIHPHDAGEAEQGISYIRDLADERKVAAIGECGLDYYRSKSSKPDQERALRLQIELALEKNLPIIFHVREAFDDFFRIIDDFPITTPGVVGGATPGVRGVIHSFGDNCANAEKALERGFYIALNGIMTFTKDENQLEAAKGIPLKSLMIETDCPFLAPSSHRGKRNEPARVKEIVEFLSKLRGETTKELSVGTTQNAESLFNL